MQSKLAVLCCAYAALWMPHAAAQPHINSTPADPRAAVPAPAYTSAFAGYRPLRDEPLAPWRDVNDEVARIGGHLGMFGGGAHTGHGAKPDPATTGGPDATRPGASK
ncbi:MAG: hypothetical protein EHM16_07295 [Betaproteobacteria bacterium]|nr:MAG: hypothetical protein EHM16_07295 [Betaproteobacteria bacterium]